jgi:hypothetical protein
MKRAHGPEVSTLAIPRQPRAPSEFSVEAPAAKIILNQFLASISAVFDHALVQISRPGSRTTCALVFLEEARP